MKVLASGCSCHHLLASKSVLVTLVALLTFALLPSVALAYANAASAPGYCSLRVVFFGNRPLDNYDSVFSLNCEDYYQHQTRLSGSVQKVPPLLCCVSKSAELN